MKAVALPIALSVMLAFTSPASTAANMNAASSLPEIGTAGAEALSLEQEQRYGTLYMRLLRGRGNIYYEPLVHAYLEELGHSLVVHADSVGTPFEFFIVRDREINAFAFFGGHVGVHSGLILAAENESELAGVLAHEITHVTQRHLARALSARQRQGPATMAATIGSILLAMAAPQAGMAALQATVASSTQAAINYTRSNEKEADRIGMQVMSRAGYDPRGVPDFFDKLSERYRYSSKPPEMLLTHPLTESRIADARGRVANYPAGGTRDSEAFHMAKVLLSSHTGQTPADQLAEAEKALKDGTPWRQAYQYSKALALLRMDRTDEALALATELSRVSPDNSFFQVLLADTYLELDQPDKAVATIREAAERKSSDRALLFHQARILYATDAADESIQMLEEWLWDHNDDLLAYRLLAKYYGELGEQGRAHLYRAEMLYQMGRYETAIDQFQLALREMQDAPLEEDRIRARIQQVQREFKQIRELG